MEDDARNIKSFQFFLKPVAKGLIIAVKARISPILAIFDPSTFPTRIPGDPFRIAVIEATNSGAEVPKATMVNPIRRSGRPSLLPREYAHLTSICPPT